MKKHFTKRQIASAISTRSGPDVSDIHNTPIGSPVLVYRPEKDMEEGPYSLLDIQGEDIVVLTSKDSQKFRSTVVKRYISPPSSTSEGLDSSPEPTTALISYNSVHNDERHSLNCATGKDQDRIEQSRLFEFSSLMD